MSLGSWCHHSLLKPTSTVNFTTGRLSAGATNQEAREVLRELSRTRAVLLDRLNVSSSEPATVTEALDGYLTLATGLVQLGTSWSDDGGGAAAATDGDSAPAAGADDAAQKDAAVKKPMAKVPDAFVRVPANQRLRRATMFKWRDSISKEVRKFQDAQADIVCMLINAGLWHCLYASKLNEDPAARVDEETSKKIYHAFRAANKYFACVDRDQLSLLPYEANTDFDERILKCMAAQCLAEAQEVTIERARSKGYKPELIASIARDNYDRFSGALTMLKTMELEKGKSVDTVRAYLKFKIHFYAAYANCFTGDHLFSEEKVGAAIKSLRQAKAELVVAAATADLFVKELAKTAGKVQSPREAPDYVTLFKHIDASLTKAEHENSFIYRDKIPTDDQPMATAKALVQSEVYQVPMVAEKWSAAQFDPKKIPSKGENVTLDMASSDEGRIQTGANHISGDSGTDCTIL